MNQAIEPYQPQQPAVMPGRSLQRAAVKRQDQFALEQVNEQFQRLGVALRLQGGSLLSGELLHWHQALGAQAMAIAEEDPAAGTRAAYVLDQLAINGSNVIARYMGAIQ